MTHLVLSFEGARADFHELDMYDAAQAMLGFQRSLAITTHLVINGEVITQAPSLKNAKIISELPAPGSWQFPAKILTPAALIAGAYAATTAPRDTVLGHAIYSAYDYIVSSSLGIHVNFDEALGQTYERLAAQDQSLPISSESRFDSAIEKCEAAIKEMHRPIAYSETASSASILVGERNSRSPLRPTLSIETYEYIRGTEERNSPITIAGKISSYNINTFKGRIFVLAEQRSLPFELADVARVPEVVARLAQSLAQNAARRNSDESILKCVAFERVSKKGRLKGYLILDVDDIIGER